MDKYRFKTTHEPVDFNWTMFRLNKDRPEEWHLLMMTLDENEDEFQVIKGSTSSANNAYDWLQSVMGMTFGELLQISLEQLPNKTSELIQVLCDLQDDFSPLKLSPESMTDKKIEADLGSDHEIAIQSKGVPSPKYTWFFWSFTDSDKEWQVLEGIDQPVLKITNFCKADAGIYKCYVAHSLTVTDANGEVVPGTYSSGTEVSVKADSVLITKQPESTSCLLATRASFQCQAEAGSDLSFQWYHEDTVLFGQNSPTLNLNGVSLDHRGRYHCQIKCEAGGVATSATATLEVTLPTPDQIEELTFDHEEIIILEQPASDLSGGQRKAAIGEKISLTCLAACKYPLKYEWLKRAVISDLISHKADVFLEITPVGQGCQLTDEVEETQRPVSAYIYQCVVRCVRTGQRVTSNSVTIPVSTYTTPMMTLPTFKIALVICQEEYEQDQYFHTLRAPKADGRSLIKALKEMDFQVLAFANLTSSEIRDAVELLCSFTDQHTYVFFYFNGHALGYGSDIYLVGKDTWASESSSAGGDQIVWHGEIEAELNNRRPLFVTVIYDSCRDQPPESVLDMVKEANKHHDEPVSSDLNFCIGYGTRQSKRSFERVDKNGISQGLYMKYLLKHINDKSLTIGGMFQQLNCSFRKGEDASIVAQMKPEYTDATSQEFYLASPLRRSTYGWQHRHFFKVCRYEALHSKSKAMKFEEEMSFHLGLSWDFGKSKPTWITGKLQNPEVVVSFILRPNEFLNEAELSLSVKLGALSSSPSWMEAAMIQLIPANVEVVKKDRVAFADVGAASAASSSEVESRYGMCSKKKDFNNDDGPIFKIDQPIVKSSASSAIGRCTLINLQNLTDSIVFRAVFVHNKNVRIGCKGTLEYRVPIIENFPKMKLRNI